MGLCLNTGIHERYKAKSNVIKYDLNLQQSALRDATTEGPVYIPKYAVVLRDGKDILAVRVSQ